MSKANGETSPRECNERVERLVMWNTGNPPKDVILLIRCDDYMGEYTMKATRVDYKKPKQGQNKNGFRKGWRWVKENGETLTRKEAPSAWSYT